MARRRRSSARRRSNPINIRRALANPVAVLSPAVKGAAGALAINAAVNYIPGIPDSLKTGNMLHLTKAGLALLLGTLGRRLPFIGAHAQAMALGALTVELTEVGKQLAMSQGVNLSGVGFMSPALIMNNARINAPRLAAVGNTGMYVRGVRGAGMYVRGGR